MHKTKLVQKIAEILNINLIFLPPYSPDLNPIEDVWRKIKGIISINNYNMLMMSQFPNTDNFGKSLVLY